MLLSLLPNHPLFFIPFYTLLGFNPYNENHPEEAPNQMADLSVLLPGVIFPSDFSPYVVS